MFSDWILAAKNVFLPIFCRQCGLRLLTEENGFYCPTCWEMSPRVERPFCTICGKPHAGAVGFGTLSNFPCAQCRALADKGGAPFRRIYGAALYDGAMKEAVKLLKFHDKARLAEPISEMMRDFAEREMECDDYDFIIPVPLHKVRERDRGFNQSRLLAEGILQSFPGSLLDLSLVRVRPTSVQSRLKNAVERRNNVIGAFAVQGDRLRNSRVLLVDDVVTTSGTVSECANALRRAGVARVDVFAAALRVASDEEDGRDSDFDGMDLSLLAREVRV
jgi:ComF family protein